MSRVATALSIALAFSLVGTAVPAGAQEDDDPGFLQLRPEMRDGTWFGSAIAGGTAVFNAEEIELHSDFEIHGNFYFDVREGEVSGTWDIIPPSAGTIEIPASVGTVAATHHATYTGGGEVTGDRTRIEADAVVTQDGTVRTSSGAIFSADSTEELPSKIAAEVTTAFCNEVYGEWVFSWEQTFQSFGWNPSFDGEWVAVRQSAEFEEQIEDSQVEELTTQITEAADRWSDMVPQLENRDHSLPFSNSEWNSMIGLIEELESIQNRLRNLTPCDREIFGDDQVERWLHLMEQGVLAIIEGAAATGQLAGWEIEMLTSIGIRTGGLAAWPVPSDPQFKEEVSELLRQQAENIVNEYWELSENGRWVPILDGADLDNLRWVLRAGKMMGWHFTLQEGDRTLTVPASEMSK